MVQWAQGCLYRMCEFSKRVSQSLEVIICKAVSLVLAVDAL